MASSTSNQFGKQEVGEKYPFPYPSNLSASSFISVKLSGRDKYRVWKTQMLCLLKSHDLFGFVDGTLANPQTSVTGKEKVGDQYHKLWTRSDALVKGWILGSLSDHILKCVVNRPTEKVDQERNEDFSAKDVWDELQTIYAPAVVLPKRQTIHGPPHLVPPYQPTPTPPNVNANPYAGLASQFVLYYSSEASHFNTVMMAIAQNFPCELNILEKYIGTNIILTRIAHFLESTTDYEVDSDVPLCGGSWGERMFRLFYWGIGWVLVFFFVILRMLACPFIKERGQNHQDALLLLENVCNFIIMSKDSDTYHNYYTNPILEATRQNAPVVVETIVNSFPDAIRSVNEDGHNIIQYAVISRSEKVYNLLYSMSEHKNVYRTIKDSSGNNLLHLAARLAPKNKLNLTSGAALQIQRELQWFKEVEGFVCPLNIKQKNYVGEAPEMVFTREHKDLVIEGEKWMKATAESYTISAALITTIVFAAAITVPGGNNPSGIPQFTNTTAFTIFAISDAISLFAAVTSLLMFLSILTARFAQQDFLHKLPTKLIIGLTTLFI